MATIEEIIKKGDEKRSAMYKKFEVFFAICDSQVIEQKKEGVNYATMYGCMFIPKNNVELVIDALKRIQKETTEELQKNIEMDNYIFYELDSHESFYTGNYREALIATQYYYPQCTMEDVKRVYDAHVNNYD